MCYPSLINNKFISSFKNNKLHVCFMIVLKMKGRKGYVYGFDVQDNDLYKRLAT